MNPITFVNEAFVGKTRALLDIEDQLHQLRENGLDFYKDISQHPNVLNINRLFEKQFGMELFCLKIDRSHDANAYTMVIAMNFDIANNVDLSTIVTGSLTEGFKWKDNNGLCIIVHINYGLLEDKSISDAELVGVILHEIGHNFADALYDDIKFANKKMMIQYEEFLRRYATIWGFLLAMPSYFRAKKLLKDYNNSTRIERESNPKKTSTIANYIDGIKANLKSYMSYRAELRARKKGGDMYREYKRVAGAAAKKQARDSLSRQNEVIADKFAGIYGYGFEISSALKKMTYTKSKAAKKAEEIGGKVAEASRDFDDAIKDICDYDCHPNLVQRINEEIKLLEREVEKEDIDPRYKMVMYQQLNSLKQLLSNITSTSGNMSKDVEAKNIYNDYVNNNNPVAVDDEIEDKIEKALDRLIDEDKKKSKNKNGGK